MYRTAATRERVKEHGISCIEHEKIDGINFYISPHKFKTCLYLNFGKDVECPISSQIVAPFAGPKLG